MADLSTRKRNDFKDSDFAYIDRQGERHLPIPDEAHVRNAIARFSQTRFESDGARKKAAGHILQAAQKYGIEVQADDAVSEAAR